MADNPLQFTQFDSITIVQPSNDKLYVRRENPAGSGVFEDFQIPIGSVMAAPSGRVPIFSTWQGSNAVAGTATYNKGGWEHNTAEFVTAIPTDSVTLGTPLQMYGMRAIAVVFAVGVTDKTTGAVILEVSGTSIDDTGVRTTSDTEVLIDDIEGADVVLNATFISTKRWLGQITYTVLNDGTGDATTAVLTFNQAMGYWYDNYGRDFTLDSFRAEIFGNPNVVVDITPDLKLFRMDKTSWLHSAAGFIIGGSQIISMQADTATETELNPGEYGMYQRTNLNIISNTSVDTSEDQGYFIEISTAATAIFNNVNFEVGLIF